MNYENVDRSWCQQQKSNMESSVALLIDLCSKYNVKMTCFVLGQIGEKNPGMIKRLHCAGHEISSHGYNHELVFKLKPDAFRKDVKLSCNVLQDLTGERILGYRAPSYSVSESVLDWFYEELNGLGLKYSSSVYPVKTFLYGINGFPEKTHYPVIHGRRSKVLEIPAPVLNLFGKRVGLYMRLFPAWYLRRFAQMQEEKGKPFFIYVHPREVDPLQPRIKLPFLISLIHYYGINGCLRRIERLFQYSNLTFVRMKDCVPS